MRRALLIGAILLAFRLTAGPAPPVTFSRDVLPVLEKNCQGCHRPGETAPFSLLTYDQARPWAKAMKEAVLLRKMPPWFADPHYGHFANDRSLSERDISTLVAWADLGAPEGDSQGAAAPVNFITGWRIPKPDLVIEMPKPVHVAASGIIDYQHVVVPLGIAEDRWVQFAEVRPGNAALVHHIVVFTREPGSKWLQDAKPGVPFVPGANGRKQEGLPGEMLTGYAPGALPVQLAAGQAILIKAGSDIVFQVHYTTNGKAGTDRSRLGLVFAAAPPAKRITTLSAYTDTLKIPAGDANYQADAVFEMGSQAELISMQPHMHARGKDFEFRALYPGGEEEILLRVPHYSYSWQLSYDPVKPVVLPKGTRIECTAHFDNSANNPANPDPRKVVGWGDQSSDEMMIGFFTVAFDASLPLKNLYPDPKKEVQLGVKSQKELDALRIVREAQTPDDRIKGIENVLTKFPDTSYKTILLQNALEIEQHKGDFIQLVLFSQRLLDIDPANAFALVTLAEETVRRIREFDLDKAEQLAKVDQYATAGLDAAKTMPKPRSDMTAARWEVAKKFFQAQAYDAMAQAAALRKNYDQAVVDYKQALSLNPAADAAVWIGLGNAYAASAKLNESSDAYDQALATPDISPQMKSVAQARKDEVTRRKRANAVPGAR